MLATIFQRGVYSDDITKGQAIGVAFELASSDEQRVVEAAMTLRRHIIEARKADKDMPYPPTTSWLLSNERQPPNLWKDFLSTLVSGKSKEKLICKVSAICQFLL